MKCKKCGKELKSSDKFCPECGEKVELKNIAECPMCHQPIAKGIIICPNCKNNIHTYNVTPPVITEQKKNSNNIRFTIIFVICCIAAVLGIVIAAQSCTNKSVEENKIQPTTSTQATTKTNIDIDTDNFTKRIYAKDISFRVSPDWNSDKSHTVYNCSETCILTFSFSKTTNDSAQIKYSDIYNPASVVEYLSHKEEYLNDTKQVIADYIDNENYYYNAGFYYEGYFYSFSLSDKQNKQDFCSKLGNELLKTIELYKPEQEQTEKPTEKPTEKATEKAQIINNTSTDGFWAKGNGDYVASGLNVTGYGVLNITNSGDSNFIVEVYEGDELVDIIVNEIGNYSGTVLIDHSGAFDLEIKSSGSWNITSSGLTVDDTTSFSGRGDCVTGITSHSGGNWHLTHNGESNFIVHEYGISKGHMDLIVNEIGIYDGVVKIDSGDNIFFEVLADGDWTINKE